jgi:hypothetical protein
MKPAGAKTANLGSDAVECRARILISQVPLIGRVVTNVVDSRHVFGFGESPA